MTEESEHYQRTAWLSVVEDAHRNLKGKCPLQDDEAIIWADERIQRLEKALVSFKKQYRLSPWIHRAVDTALEGES